MSVGFSRFYQQLESFSLRLISIPSVCKIIRFNTVNNEANVPWIDGE